MTRRKKAKQPQPERVPILGGVTLDALTTRYRCRCGNTALTSIRLTAVTCTRCGQAMRVVKDMN